jgi:hypothetical protein
MSNKLEDWEISLIKGMLEHYPELTQQAIHSYFTYPGRDIHQNVIGKIKRRKIGSTHTIADASETKSFRTAKDHLSDINPSWMYHHIARNNTTIKSLTLDWWPVGQGLFSSGVVKAANGKAINWVYDCGSSSAKPALDNSIGAYKSQQDRFNLTSIKLVVISHLDKDHISGLATLLSKRSVEYLLLPYIPLWRRLLLAIESGVTEFGDELELFINPTAYITERLGAKVGRIVYVQGAGPEDLFSTDATIDRLGPDDELHFEFEEEVTQEIQEDDASQDQIPTTVHILKKGGRITSPLLWEFVPYNDAEMAPKVDRSFIKKVMQHAKVLTSKGTDNEKDGAIQEIKELYDCNFDTPEKRNLISLFLYSGPINAKLALNYCIHNTPSYLEIERFSQLHTGDGYLNTDERLNSFLKFFQSQGRLEKTAFFQVMHHGSEKNWKPGTAKQINPRWSIFSSDPWHNRFKHPNAKVLRDFYPYGIVQVDKNRGFHCKYIFV